MTSTALLNSLASREAPQRAQVRASLRADPAPLIQALVSHHSELILAHIGKFISDPEDARDLLQDVWLQILRKGYTYGGTGSLLGWALTIARNTCLSALRRPDFRRTLQPIGDAGDESRRQFAFESRTPDVVTRQRELRHDIDCAIRKLSPRQQAIVRMRLVHGRSTRETAAELGCSTGTVKGSLFRAKRQLRSELAPWLT